MSEPLSKTATAPAHESFEELLERLRRRLERILYRYAIPPKDAEDVLQTALLLYVEHSRRQEIHDPEAWIAATLRNRCLMYWRSCRRAAEPVLLDPGALAFVVDLRESVPSPGGQLHARVDLSRLGQQLRPVEVRVIKLSLLGGLTLDQVAQVTGYASSSIRKTRHRILERLRKGFDPPDELEAASAQAPPFPTPPSGDAPETPRPRIGHTVSTSFAPNAAPAAAPAPPTRSRQPRMPNDRSPSRGLIRRLERLEHRQRLLRRSVEEARRLAGRPYLGSTG